MLTPLIIWAGSALSEITGFYIRGASPILLNGSATAHFSVTTAGAPLFTGSAPLDWLGWPGMQDLGTHWVCSYSVRETHFVAGIGTYRPLRFSDDDGATWTAENVYLDDDPVTGLVNDDTASCYLLAAPNGDVLFFQTITGTSYVDEVYRSSDGGKTWTHASSGIPNPELRMQAGYGFTQDGVIYVPLHKFSSQPGNTTPWEQEVWVSSDNGTTWELRGTVPYAPGDSGNEFSIAYTSGSSLIAVCRDAASLTTYQNTSNDLGATWGARQSIAGMGIYQQGRIRNYANGLIMFGREGEKANGGVFTCVWYSADNGATWGRKFQPDTSAWNDAAYCDVLQRADGKFYCMTYGGTDNAANIRSAVFEIA